LMVGRSEDCDIFLGEKKISRKHCRISVTAQEIRLNDLQSTNGSFVNAKKVSDVTIQNEDKIRFGSSVIQVSVVTDASLGIGKKGTDEPETGQIDVPGSSAGQHPVAMHFGEARHDPSGVIDIPSSEPYLDEIGEPPSPPPPPPPKPKETSSKNLVGNLSAMGLADLLQNLAQNKKSGLLILNGPREGKIWVVSGKVLQAEVGGAFAAKAVYRMLSWNEGAFELLPLPKDFKKDKIEKPINETVEGLLMEGFRQFDEMEKVKKGLPPWTANLKLKLPFAAPLSKLHPRVLDVLQLVIAEGSFEKVLDVSPLSDLETAKVIFYLIKKEYIVAN